MEVSGARPELDVTDCEGGGTDSGATEELKLEGEEVRLVEMGERKARVGFGDGEEERCEVATIGNCEENAR